MVDLRVIGRPMVAFAAAIVVTACASAGAGGGGRPSIPPPVPTALSAAEVAGLAEVLRLIDSREPSPDAFTSLLTHSSPTVRAAAATGYAGNGAPAGVGPLVELLADPDTAVAAAAAFALGQVGDSAAVSALAALLRDPEVSRVTAVSEAAYALGKIRAAEARAALIEFLGSDAAEDRRLASVTESALLAIWRFPRDSGADPIAHWTSFPDPEVRWAATYALSRRSTPSASPRLLHLAGDEDPRVRAMAVRALTAARVDSSSVSRGQALEVLLRAAEDPHYAVRINAIGAMGSYTAAGAVEALLSIIGRGPHESFAAIEALGRMGSAAASAADRLSDLAEDRATHVALRAAALASLAQVDPDAGAAAAAILAGSDEWRIRAAAAPILAKFPESAGFAALVDDADGRIAASALGALVAANPLPERLRAYVVAGLASPDVGVRTAALAGARALADPALLAPILDAYGASTADLWNDAALGAIDALGALRVAEARPERAFFARFPSAHDPVVHRRAVEVFGDAALRAWGAPVPIPTNLAITDYREIVERRIAPLLAGAPPPIAEIVTDSGVIRLRLHAARAPLTVESFSTLSEQGYFDGQEWPRVVPNFVVQGGDPRGDTSGGPGYVIRDELGRARYRTGTLGMALAGPDTGGSQFFITHSPHPHLDGIYTVFGEVLEGQSVTERILPADPIRSIRIIDR